MPATNDQALQSLDSHLNWFATHRWPGTLQRLIEIKEAAQETWEFLLQFEPGLDPDKFDSYLSLSLEECLNTFEERLQDGDLATDSVPVTSAAPRIPKPFPGSSVVLATPGDGVSTYATDDLDDGFLKEVKQCFLHYLIEDDMERRRSRAEEICLFREEWLESLRPPSPAKKEFQRWTKKLTDEVLRRAGRITRKYIRLFYVEKRTLEETAGLIDLGEVLIWLRCGRDHVRVLYDMAGRSLADSAPRLLASLIEAMYYDSELDDETIALILSVPTGVVVEFTGPFAAIEKKEADALVQEMGTMNSNKADDSAVMPRSMTT